MALSGSHMSANHHSPCTTAVIGCGSEPTSLGTDTVGSLRIYGAENATHGTLMHGGSFTRSKTVHPIDIYSNARAKVECLPSGNMVSIISPPLFETKTLKWFNVRQNEPNHWT